LIANVPEYSNQFPTCTAMIDEINGYMCNTSGLGIMLFESLDPDAWDRSIQPVYYRLRGEEAY